jgi:NADH:ubiquinone oxidoreductase subunit 4 (subunit M)
MGALLFGLLIIGGVNSVLSAVYYIKVMKVMILEGRAEDLEGREPVRLREPFSAVSFTVLVALLVFILGILWAPLDKYSNEGAARFAQSETPAAANPQGGPQRPGPRRQGPRRQGPRRQGAGQQVQGAKGQ